MKKIIIFSLLFSAVLLGAESVQFVSTLSSPVGVVSRAETADANTVTRVPTLNYCTDAGTNNAITVRTSGTEGASFSYFTFQGGSLVGDAQLTKWIAPTVVLETRGNINVKNMMVKDLQVSSSGNHALRVPYAGANTGNMQVVRAASAKAFKADKITVGNSTWFDNANSPSGSGTAKWKNLSEYGGSISCKTASECNGKTVLVLTTANPTGVTPQSDTYSDDGGGGGGWECTYQEKTETINLGWKSQSECSAQCSGFTNQCGAWGYYAGAGSHNLGSSCWTYCSVNLTAGHICTKTLTGLECR